MDMTDDGKVFDLERCNLAIEAMCDALNTLGCTVAEALHAVRSMEHALEGMMDENALALMDRLEGQSKSGDSTSMTSTPPYENM